MTDIDFSTFQGLLNTRGTADQTDVFARFYDRSVKTEEMNVKTGLPVFKTVCFVEIRIKNNNTDIYDQPATEEKMKRFSVEYNRYLLCKKQTEDGAPLEQFSFLNVAQVDTLKHHGIFTVEALAALNERQAQDLDITDEWMRATEFLSKAKQNWQEHELYVRCQALEAEVMRLTKALEQRTHTTERIPKKERKSRVLKEKEITSLDVSTRLKEGAGVVTAAIESDDGLLHVNLTDMIQKGE